MVTLKATHIVRPAQPTPDEIMYLIPSDQIQEITHRTSTTIYFYKHSAALDDGEVVLRLKDSLSKALVLFYPLAGRLNWAAEGGSRLELYCNGNGVPIFEADTELAVEDFGDFTPTLSMQALIPSVDYTKPIDEMPLFIVQLTKFRCGGVSIGLGISHVVADGMSSLHFVNEWAKIARGAVEPTVPPFFDRKVLETEKPLSTTFDPSVMFRPLPTLIGEEDNMEQRKKLIPAAFLNLTNFQIEKLRNKSNLDFDGSGSGSSGFSRYEAVAAHIWRCITKCRRHSGDQPTSLIFVADFRNKLKPPLPKTFFGNALIRLEARDKSGNLLSNTIGTTCKKIREAINKVTDDTVRAYLDYLNRLPDVDCFRLLDNTGQLKEGLVGLGDPNCRIVTWTTLPVYGADFGWGKEIHMGPGPPGCFAFDGRTLILPGHDGDGSFIVAIWLQEEHMETFKKCFYDDI